MSKFFLEHIKLVCLSLFFGIFVNTYGSQDSYLKLKEQYDQRCAQFSDINGHLPTLRQLAKECSSVVEIGLRDMISSFALLQGLSEKHTKICSYTGIDIASPPLETLSLAKTLSKENRIVFQFWQANDMNVEIPTVELLFIDSLHTYCHLSYELDKFSSKVTKYIAMHDTSEPWGSLNDTEYRGDYSEYPPQFDRTKKGLWLAVEDFLRQHPEWTLDQRYFNDHGFTILKRIAK